VSKKVERKGTLRAILILIAAILTFGGPTYILMILQKLDVPQPLLALLGLASLTLGIVLLAKFIKEEEEKKP
jgi:hypothetical protein